MKPSSETIEPVGGDLPGAWAEDLCARIERHARLFSFWHDAAQNARLKPCWRVIDRWGRSYHQILEAQAKALEDLLEAQAKALEDLLEVKLER